MKRVFLLILILGTLLPLSTARVRGKERARSDPPPSLIEVKIPYEFHVEEVAKASELNANFTALKEAIEQLQELIIELQTQNNLLEEENRVLKEHIAELETRIETLEKSLGPLEPPTPTISPQPTPSQKILLRSKPLIVSKDAAQKVFGLDENWRPLKYIENSFKDRGETVVDHATGLMWQKSGSDKPLTYEQAQAYIEELNRKRFAGYNDWRLPTIEELMSLLELEKQSTDLYINSIFDSKQWRCWSADKRSLELAWDAHFDYGDVYWHSIVHRLYVRGVRS